MSEIAITKPQPAEVYGHTDRIVALSERMRNMIPGASDAPAAIIWKAAQIAHLHKLDPFSGDVQVYSVYKNPGNDPSKWIVNVGISAWRRAAQRQAKHTAQFRDMEPDELKKLNYPHHPNDIGVECTLYRLDVARECKELGIPYEPAVAVGIWRKQAYKVGGDWKEDQIPNTETPHSVAKRRAEKKALKIAFSLDYPDDETDQTTDGTWQVISDLEEQVVKEEQDRQPMHREEPNREEDGDLLFA